MVSRVPPSEWRWLRALLVLGTFTVGLMLLGLVANVALYFSDILLILVLSWLFAFILSPIVSRILRVFPVLPRLAVVVAVYLGVFIVVVALPLLLAGTLATSIGGFITNLPTIQAPAAAACSSPWQQRLDVARLPGRPPGNRQRRRSRASTRSPERSSGR